MEGVSGIASDAVRVCNTLCGISVRMCSVRVRNAERRVVGAKLSNQ